MKVKPDCLSGGQACLYRANVFEPHRYVTITAAIKNTIKTIGFY
ncbi:hypothetical protein [Anaerosolibacter carboniphilus]|nr:hypothetical protein [Anaerosolibacter carboniphilus]